MVPIQGGYIRKNILLHPHNIWRRSSVLTKSCPCQHGRRSSKWFGGAPNFSPKNDLMHWVLHEKSIGFSVEIEVFSKKKGFHWNWDGFSPLVCPNKETICPNFQRFEPNAPASNGNGCQISKKLFIPKFCSLLKSYWWAWSRQLYARDHSQKCVDLKRGCGSP